MDKNKFWKIVFIILAVMFLLAFLKHVRQYMHEQRYARIEEMKSKNPILTQDQYSRKFR